MDYRSCHNISVPKLMEIKLEILYIPMEETAEGGIRPFLRFPPLTTLPLVLVLRDRFFGDLQIDELEEQATPRDKTLSTLLVLAEMHYKTRLV